MAINRRGDVVVGFAGQAGDFDGNFLKPFIWTEGTGMEELELLEGDVSGNAVRDLLFAAKTAKSTTNPSLRSG